MLDAPALLGALSLLLDAQRDDPDDYALIVDEATDLFGSDQNWSALVPATT
ncbi:hypothetical protein [Streptomyces cinereoruber]|uniref:hypothetical protein n=1 Tax=Streptomyces cinereoruber TaxID=67260 RepID=UPI00363719E6